MPKATLARAISGYDAEHEAALLAAITTAIVDTSKVSDCNAVAIRTAEIISALTTAMAVTLALSPAATRSPTAVRKTLDELGRRLRRRLAKAEASLDVADFVRHAFRGDDVGGTA